MNELQNKPAANDGYDMSPEKALNMFNAYHRAREKDPSSIHIMWRDDFLALLPPATAEQLAALPLHPF